MTWIKTVPLAEATGRLKTLYDRIKGPGDDIDNIMLAHSLRPHTLEGHMTLYKHVLHHPANETPKWLLEAVGLYVSLLNGCGYCIEHHFAGIARLLGNRERADEIRSALSDGDPARAFTEREAAMMDYVRRLTLTPAEMAEAEVDTLREAGLSDGEILELNQVAAYFAYANRTVQGLGITTDGDVLGLSPGDSDDPDNWEHR